MTTYKEYKQGLKEQRERAQAIRNEVFSDKAEKLETDLVRTEMSIKSFHDSALNTKIVESSNWIQKM